MSYGLILTTLREFDLITDEQMETAWAEYQQARIETREEIDQFRAEWKANSSRWHRFWGDWFTDWLKQERGSA